MISNHTRYSIAHPNSISFLPPAWISSSGGCSFMLHSFAIATVDVILRFSSAKLNKFYFVIIWKQRENCLTNGDDQNSEFMKMIVFIQKLKPRAAEMKWARNRTMGQLKWKPKNVRKWVRRRVQWNLHHKQFQTCVENNKYDN